MGVVELHRKFAMELAHRQPLGFEDAQHVLQRAGHKEDLLAQAQPLALIELIVGVEHLAEGFALHLGQHRLGVRARVERGEVEGFWCHRRPQAQRVGRTHLKAKDGCVVGDPQHGVLPDAHGVAPLRTNHLPRVAAGQPGVGAFLLAVGCDALAKNAELVADAIADGGQLQACQRFLEAGRQPTQPPITEAGLGFASDQRLEVEPQLLASGFRFSAHAEVHQIVFEMGPQQIFG